MSTAFESSPPATASTEVAQQVNPALPEPDLLDHEYDGIREYDNPLPGWWVKIFWASFFFAIGYVFHFFFGNGVSVAEGYESEMAAVRAEQAKVALRETVSEEGLHKLMVDQASLGEAKAIFAQRCTPCHGEHAQGVIGPNLTDGYWLHGSGTLMDIHKTISEGVPAKGMPTWRMQLSAVQVRKLAAFIGSLRNTNVPGKAPEGVLAAVSQ
jgi:cytochrome c oxidase cbb3-type subunit III